MLALILKTIGIKGGAIIALVLALGFATWQVNHLKSEKAKLEQTIFQQTNTIALLEAEKQGLQGEITKSVGSYEALETACQNRVKEAVRIARIPHVYPKVKTNETNIGIDANCPSIRVSDIQGN